jgi:hypothetical protein
MDDTLEQLRDNISTLSDEELVRMVTVEADAYRSEAIEFARAELAARNVSVPKESGGEAVVEEEEEEAPRRAPEGMAAVSGAVCFVCSGPLRHAALVAEKEMIVTFRDNDEQRFVDVLACARCGEMRLVVDYDSDVEE